MNQMKISKTFGNKGKNRWTNLLVIMEYRNVSASDVSKKSGIPINTIVRWLNNKPEIISCLKKLAESLDVSVGDLLEDDLLGKVLMKEKKE